MERDAHRTRSRRPTAAWPGSPTRTPTRTIPRPRPGSRSSPPRTRSCRIPTSGIATTGSATATASTSATRSAVGRPAGSATCSTPSSDPATRSGRSAAGGRSGPPRGPDLEVHVTLDFEDAVFGSQTDVTVRTALACDDCGGSGAAPGSSPETCPDCGGAGEVRTVRQTVLGQIVSATPCRRCGGPGRSSTRRAPRAPARAGSSRTRPTRSTCPPASTPARRSDSPVGARSVRAVALPATST